MDVIKGLVKNNNEYDSFDKKLRLPIFKKDFFDWVKKFLEVFLKYIIHTDSFPINNLWWECQNWLWIMLVPSSTKVQVGFGWLPFSPQFFFVIHILVFYQLNKIP